jgi:hypothetical protein
MGDVLWRGGSQEEVRPTTITRLKMEDPCNFYNVIEIFYQRKITKAKRGGPLVLSNSKWHWHNWVKTHLLIYVDIQILPLLRGGIDWQGVSRNNSILWLESQENNKSLGGARFGK